MITAIQIFLLLIAVIMILLIVTKASSGGGLTGGGLTGGGMSESAFGASGGDVVNKIIAVIGGILITGFMGLGIYNRYVKEKPKEYLEKPKNWPIVKEYTGRESSAKMKHSGVKSLKPSADKTVPTATRQ